jgi:hypothetical protein
MHDQLELYRADATNTVESFQRRYHEGGNRDRFIAIAQRWATALHRQDLDPNELSEVIRDAERYKRVADIAFYGFIIEMRAIYHWLWKQHLTRRLGEGDGNGIG